MNPRPSSAHRWVRCHASPALEALFPDDSGQAAEDGNAAHWAGAVRLSTGTMPEAGTVAPNGVVLDMQMVEGAYVYVDAVLSQRPAESNLWIEERMAIPSVYGDQDRGGTPDLWYLTSEGLEIHVWDFKYGYGIVEAFENWQLLCYANGVLDWLEHTRGIPASQFEKPPTVVLHVVQPRPYHPEGPVREWRLPVESLRQYAAELNQAFNICLSGTGNTVTGPHCKNCRALPECPSYQRATMVAMDVINGTELIDLPPHGISIEITALRKAAKLAGQLLAARETQAIELIRGGCSVPGYGSEQGLGNLSWDKPPAEVFALGDMMGVELRAEQKPLTPTQGKNAGLSGELVNQYSTRKPTSMKLVETDKTAAARVFKQP